MKDIYWLTESTDMSGAPKIYTTEEPLTDKSVEFVHFDKYAEAIAKYSDAVDKYSNMIDKYIETKKELDALKTKGIYQ